jgi:hypothetical protein
MYRHRQLHLWITDHDYYLLRDIADERKETLSSVIRRLIKLHRPCPLAAEGAQPPAAEALCQPPV